jgi:hypothetical protein
MRAIGKKILTVLVVVTHLGLLLSGREAGGFNGFFGELYVLTGSRTGNASVDGELVEVGGVVLVGGRSNTLLNGELVDVRSVLLVGSRGHALFNGELVEVGVLAGSGSRHTRVNGVFVDLGVVVGLVSTRCDAVYSSVVGLGVVGGTVTLAVLTFSEVNGAGVRLWVRASVNVDVGVCVLGARCSRAGRLMSVCVEQ